jgi:hypothetical protein
VYPEAQHPERGRAIVTVHARVALLGLAAALAGCAHAATSLPLSDIQRAQAVWKAHHLTRYAYRYETMGFSTNLDGQEMRLVVLGDTVRSAQFVATNDSVPVLPSILPTIDALFAMAVAADRAGTLVAAEFDSTFGYPTRLQLSGLPDASGVIIASTIELLP